MTSISDSELRKRLESLGVSVGPIMDTTRAVYLNKLRSLEGKKVGCSNIVKTPPPTTSTTPLSSPPPDLSNSRTVVQGLLASLNDPTHVSCDTVFMFPSGEMLLASRAILASQCSKMAPLLYNKEEPYPVTITNTGDGHSALFYVRTSEYVVDVKEKISLATGVPVGEQQLSSVQAILENARTLQSYGVGPGTTLLLSVSPSSPQHGCGVCLVNPNLSISHLTLGLGLDRLSPTSPHPQQVPIPPLTQHIVHLHDISHSSFRMFVRYLYSRELVETDQDSCAVDLAACYVLGQVTELPSLCREALAMMRQCVDKNTAILIAEKVNCLQLKQALSQF